MAPTVDLQNKKCANRDIDSCTYIYNLDTFVSKLNSDKV